ASGSSARTSMSGVYDSRSSVQSYSPAGTKCAPRRSNRASSSGSQLSQQPLMRLRRVVVHGGDDEVAERRPVEVHHHRPVAERLGDRRGHRLQDGVHIVLVAHPARQVEQRMQPGQCLEIVVCHRREGGSGGPILYRVPGSCTTAPLTAYPSSQSPPSPCSRRRAAAHRPACCRCPPAPAPWRWRPTSPAPCGRRRTAATTA